MSQFSFLCQFSSNPIESLQPSTVDSDCKIAEVASIKRFQNRLDSRLVLTALLPVSDRVAYLSEFYRKSIATATSAQWRFAHVLHNLDQRWLVCRWPCPVRGVSAHHPKVYECVISQKAHIEAWLIEYLKIGIAFKRGNIR